MSQNPTKAADNAFCIARKNAAAWSETLNSREGASELLCIDRTRIARIELGSLIPYPEEVLLMADGYNAPELLNHYCSTLCPIGCRTQQKLDVAGLDRLVVKLVSAFRKDDSLGDILLDITEDGVISKEEMPQLEHVLSQLNRLEKIIGELKLWAQKNIQESEETS